MASFVGRRSHGESCNVGAQWPELPQTANFVVAQTHHISGMASEDWGSVENLPLSPHAPMSISFLKEFSCHYAGMSHRSLVLLRAIDIYWLGRGGIELFFSSLRLHEIHFTPLSGCNFFKSRNAREIPGTACSNYNCMPSGTLA